MPAASATPSAKPTKPKLVMTRTGFSFLFKPLSAQVWHLILSYMDKLAERNLNRQEILRVLFRLSVLAPSAAAGEVEGYETKSLTPSQRAFVLVCFIIPQQPIPSFSDCSRFSAA